MMTLVIVLGFATLLVAGFISLFRGFSILVEKRELLLEFRKRFVELANSYFEEEKLDNTNYQWLLENVDEVSATLGGADTMAYRPAFANYVINNYQLLINLIPSFNSSTGAHPNDVSSADSILVRFVGILNKQIEKDRKFLINPIRWLIEGVSAVLSIPIWLLSQFGILGNDIYRKIRKSNILRFFAGLISFISLVDAVYAMATGDSFTVGLAKRLLSLF